MVKVLYNLNAFASREVPFSVARTTDILLYRQDEIKESNSYLCSLCKCNPMTRQYRLLGLRLAKGKDYFSAIP